MDNLPARVPHTLFPDLVAAFVPPHIHPNALELVITIEDENIPVREFAEYLALVDRLYGRLTSESLRSYAHKGWGHLTIAETHKSDLEIIFRHLDPATLIVISLFLKSLKSLPTMFKTTMEGIREWSESAKNLAEARQIDEQSRHMEVVNRHEESRLARENRRQIREELQQEPDFAKLDEARRNQLIALLDALAMEESARIPMPKRFARHKVKAVWLRIKGQKPPR